MKAISRRTWFNDATLIDGDQMPITASEMPALTALVAQLERWQTVYGADSCAYRW